MAPGLERAGSGVVAPGLERAGSGVVVHRLSRSLACGIFPDQGSNSYLLHWQADFFTTEPAGKPPITTLLMSYTPKKKKK